MEIFIVSIALLALVILMVLLRRKPSTNSAALQSIETDGEHSMADSDHSPAEETTAFSVAEPSAVQTSAAEKDCTEIDHEESETAHDDDSDDEKGVTHNVQLIADLHKVFEEDKVFLRPDIHIEDVAKMLYTNRTYVTRLMRQEYGLSFIEYVNISRIQYSQSLLYSTDLTLDDIAEKSGFLSTSNFCRAFKRYIGSSPLAWKRSLK